MRPDFIEEILAVFIVAQQMCDILTTPLPVDGYTTHVNQRNNTQYSSYRLHIGYPTLTIKGFVLLSLPIQLSNGHVISIGLFTLTG